MRIEKKWLTICEAAAYIGMSQGFLRHFRFRWGSPELEEWAGHPELKGCEFVDPVTCKAKVIRDEW